MAALTVQDIVPGGLEAVFASAAGGGDTIANDSSQRIFAEVVNGSGGDITVTIAKKSGLSTVNVPGVGNVAIADITVTVTAGERRHIGPFTDAYTQANGNVNITYSGVTSLTIAALRLPMATPH